MRAIDLAYHVRAGDLSLRTGEVLAVDPFTITNFGRPWLNQQWLAQLMFAAAHRLLGWAGVAITYAAAMGSGFTFLYRSCRRSDAGPRTATLLTLIAFLVASGSLAARPQALAVPLFTGTWLLVSRRDAWTWLVPFLALVWANVHGSFVLAPLLVMFALVEDLSERRPVGRTISLLLATVVATFVTPFGPDVWSYAIEISRNETIRNWVAEWRPPSPLSLSGGPFWVSGLAVFVTGVTRRRIVQPVDVARLFVFFVLGVPAIRGTLWWALAAPPVVARWFRFSERDPERGVRRATGRPDVLKATTAACIIAMLPLALFLRAGTDPLTHASQRLAGDAPEVLAAATGKALPVGSHLLVYQPFASWFEYSLPEHPVMVDSRIELFPDAQWHDYDRAITAAEGWEQVLDRYRIEGVILPPEAVLREELLRGDGWRPVFDGSAGSVFVRT